MFTFGGSLAQLRWDGDAGVSDSSTLQWAAVVAGRVYLDGKRRHYFALGGSYGHGTAGNIISLTEGGVPGAVLQPDGSLENLPAWNIAPALHLQLTDKLSSNLAWAWSEVQSSDFRLPDHMEGGGATHVNLIYDITPRFRVGGEYMYGTRRNVGGAEGHANRMQFMSMYTF